MFRIITRERNWALVPVFAVILALPGFAPVVKGAEQVRFESAEAAVEALVEALKNDDVGRLTDIFGKEHEKEVLGTDEAAGRESREQFHQRYLEMNRLRPDGEDRMVLLVGEQAWPVPIPLVKESEGWRWETEEGLEEIIDRRVGKNELTAIDVLRTYVTAQREYSNVDRDGDEVLEYAQVVRSTEGKKDGLYWEEENDEDLSPFGPLVADGKAYLEDREPGDPYYGYYYKILTRQGENVPGGRYDYLINDNMLAGFAAVAFPADYGFSGVMTFVVNHNGQVQQRDLGELSDVLGAAMEIYNPNDTWVDIMR